MRSDVYHYAGLRATILGMARQGLAVARFLLQHGARVTLSDQRSPDQLTAERDALTRFADEHGVYPVGTYLKNPPGSRHAPFTEQGCTLLVKLRHMQPDDGERVVIDTHRAPWLPGLVQGLSVKPLSDFAGEHAALVQWAPGTVFTAHRHWGGEEIYVIEGVFEDEHGRYPAGTWMRSPHLSQHAPFSRSGCTIFVKVGHLPEQG